ncbi:hypothetical protein DRQ16_01640, partial [bacterium]
MISLLLLFSLVGTDNLSLKTVIESGTPPPANYIFTDANHNGKNEIYLPWHDDSTPYRNGTAIWERENDSLYLLIIKIRSDMDYTYLGEICGGLSLDGDSLTDLVLGLYDSGGNNIGFYVYESPSYDSFPTESVWADTTRPLPNPWDAYITDLDQDGKKEIFLRARSDLNTSTRIYECTGDNEYALVYCAPPPVDDYVGGMCWGDWDLDGKMEFAYGSVHGGIFVYENTGVGIDDYQLVWADSVDDVNAYKAASGGDMDGDGKPEFVIGGMSLWFGVWYYVFEATGDNSYANIHRIVHHWEYSSTRLLSYSDVRIGDMDDDSIPEMLITRYNAIEIWKAMEDNVFRKIIYYGLPRAVNEWWDGLKGGIYDLNGNGYGEVVVGGTRYDPDGN